jgi:hypothetical protein
VVVGTLLEVVRMTATTIRLIGGSAPDHRLIVPAVAVRAVEILAVITGIHRSRMIEIRWLPVVRIVTSVARERGHEVSGIFAGRDRSIVATYARARSDGSVIEACRRPAKLRVAEFAFVAGWNVVSVLACLDRSIVAADAIGRNSEVIKIPCRQPSPLTWMTKFTLVRGRNMQ